MDRIINSKILENKATQVNNGNSISETETMGYTHFVKTKMGKKDTENRNCGITVELNIYSVT
jgi:hypothetical protein